MLEDGAEPTTRCPRALFELQAGDTFTQRPADSLGLALPGDP
jgi:hypothetical protein